MEVLGYRFCVVSEQAEELATFFRQLGVNEKDLGLSNNSEQFSGAVFPAGKSWVEIWQQGEQMPAGTMLQILVDNADEFAEHAKTQGLDPQGPFDQHGEHMYFLTAPTGLQVSFQSTLD